MSKKEKGAVDASTEDKIKNAARTVFQKKGFAATRTRDIAEEAGINLALLNYYFRTKEKLFEIVMMETLSSFLQGMAGVFNNENTTFEKKIELLAINYIDFCTESPNIPIFVLSEIRNRPEDLLKIIPVNQISHAVIIQQFQEKVKKGEINEPNLLHFIMNIMGLIIFPFVGQPILTAIGELNNAQFNQLMQERKKLIPQWIKAMFFAP
ncbi:MAG: TetR/AcrR family transcriptional regulator [Bacteroidales bacterium]|jgi:AcrR family transcriptional regulator|nr:TetR/AcrR family transcriptional regulator [Bacteroidales bacterium]